MTQGRQNQSSRHRKQTTISSVGAVDPLAGQRTLAHARLPWRWALTPRVALRYFNASGATPLLGEDHRPETHLLPRVLEAAHDAKQSFKIYGDDYPTPDGTCIRDFVHVLDIARAHVLALRALPNVHFEIYNVGHGRGYSIREVLEVVEAVTGRKLPVRVGPRRPGDPAVLVASPQKLRRELKWKPRCSDLHTIVQSAWTWKLSHPNGYRGNSARTG